MTRQEAIDRWKEVAEAVFWAEDKLLPEWTDKLRVAKTITMPECYQHTFDDYLTAIATEIVSKTSDEQLAAMEW